LDEELQQVGQSKDTLTTNAMVDPVSPIGRLRIGVDVGGTFTDIIMLLSDGRVASKKILSSPPNYNEAIRAGIAELLREQGVGGARVAEISHGATVATNCILTRTGAVTGLITTTGFRDVLEIRRMRMHRLYDIFWDKPKPLVPRRLRLEVGVRTDPHSGAEEPLNDVEIEAVAERFIKEGVESIAVCFLHAYANGENEKRVREILLRRCSSWFVSISSEVLPEIKEYERTSTTVINAYVQPAVSHYAIALKSDIHRMEISAPIMVMQSNGGMLPIDTMCRFPVHIIESGAAAGVMGASAFAKQASIADVISFDMGGTTAKAAIIEEGEIARSPEYEVGGEISVGHRLLKGSGYLLRVPSIDLSEVSAGGGSIAWIDSVGALKVGPQSAGALPGPACYARGGTEPTITDANVHLGLTNPRYLAGGALTIDPDLAERAIRDKLASPLDVDCTTAAWAVRSVADASLIRALRAVSIERGRDPRHFTMMAFGGMGPVHAIGVAEQLGVERVVVPPLAGLFSALGLLFAQIEHHLIRSYYADPVEPDFARLNGLARSLIAEAVSMLQEEGFDTAHRFIELFADLRYVGQDHALTLRVEGDTFDVSVLAGLERAFGAQHERVYGYRSDRERVQVVGLRCVGRALSPQRQLPDRLNILSRSSTKHASRRCYFGPEHGWLVTAIVSRTDLARQRIVGPAVVEEDGSATVLNPGWAATLDDRLNIVAVPAAPART
jgi:N-methylhydantoinase A